MPDFLRAVCGNVRLLLEDLSAWLRPALASARSTSADLLQRLADAIAPQSPTPLADADPEFAEMLAGLGAEPPPVGQAADTTLADTTIRSLTHDLHGLRDLGDRLARAEQDKLALAARVRELEAGVGSDAHGEHAAVARLERKGLALYSGFTPRRSRNVNSPPVSCHSATLSSPR